LKVCFISKHNDRQNACQNLLGFTSLRTFGVDNIDSFFRFPSEMKKGRNDSFRQNQLGPKLSAFKEIMPLQYYGLGTLGRGRWAVAGMVTHGAHAYSRY
jgi:hypothetical protein